MRIHLRHLTTCLALVTAACSMSGGHIGRSTQGLDIETVTTPLCQLNVSHGYPVGRRCNAAARALPEFVGCELDDLNAPGQLHGVSFADGGLSGSQVTWWCQSEMASPLVIYCLDNPTATDQAAACGVHVYPGIALYNTRAAISAALSSGAVPMSNTAPDGLPCPNVAGGDVGGVADMDGQDGPVVNYLVNPLTDAQMYNAFMDGDFNNINARVPFYQGKCFRPATHTVFLAQGVVIRKAMQSPMSGCPTLHDPFALDGGNPDLNQLNSLLQDVGCPTEPSVDHATTDEQAACRAIVADQRRIIHDGKVGLFPMAFTFTQLFRQFQAFRGLGCDATYNLTDMDPQRCPTSCAGQACSATCPGACGICSQPNESCTDQGTCAPECLPVCAGKQCGSDGCGGTCGTCATGQMCAANGACVPEASVPVSFANDILPIFQYSCQTCHEQNKLDVNLTADVAYQALVNKKSFSCKGRTFVIPGDANDSYLMDKVLGIQGLCAGSSMRYNLTSYQLQQLADWINQGAPNN